MVVNLAQPKIHLLDFKNLKVAKGRAARVYDFFPVMQVHTERALPLQFPVQAEHAWMYDSDTPLPFSKTQSVLDAANCHNLNMDDLQMLGDLAEQYVSNHENMALKKCMLVRRAISYMDIAVGSDQDIVFKF